MSQQAMNLQPGSHIHLMGICGTAMASLAGLLKDQGFKVTGSDQNVYPPMSTQLEQMGIEIKQGYKKENLSPRPDLVIVGNVISRKYEEAQALLESDIPYTSLPKALGEFVIADRNSIVLSGTHGKTTTTSIMATVAEACGIDAGFLVGGIPENFGKSFQYPKGDWFIIEGDEYDTAFFDKVPKFIYYKPKYVVLTSVEFDHADIYSSLEEIRKSFRQLIALIPEDGLLVANAEDKEVMELAQAAKCRVVSYGLEAGDYHVVDRASLVGRNQFSVVKGEQRVADVALKLFGAHNTMNALGAFALASELGWENFKILQGLANFKGVSRRQSVIGEPRGITIVEDFAHHPTAVRLTIQAIKEQYSGRKIHAVFEPRSATSRRAVFQKEYEDAFSGAGHAVILPQPFNQESIPEAERFSSKKLVEDLKARGGEAYYEADVDGIVEHLSAQAHPGDVILLMSNGGFGGIYQKLLSALS